MFTFSGARLKIPTLGQFRELAKIEERGIRSRVAMGDVIVEPERLLEAERDEFSNMSETQAREVIWERLGLSL